jgi:mannose/fructose/N-acetylgalactosamine-specific phosphotransferase system component IID
MAKKKPTALAVVPSVEKEKLPSEVTSSKLYQRKKVNKNNLPNYQERMLLLFAPHIIPETMKSIYSQVKEGNKDAIQLALQIYNFIQRQGGVSVVNNIFNQNNNSSANERAFDAIARRLGESVETITLKPEN